MKIPALKNKKMGSRKAIRAGAFSQSYATAMYMVPIIELGACSAPREIVLPTNSEITVK